MPAKAARDRRFYRVGHDKLRVFGSAVQVIYIHKLAAVGGVKGKPAHEKAFAIGGKIDGAVVLAVKPIDETELKKGVRLYFAERSGEVQLKRAVEKAIAQICSKPAKSTRGMSKPSKA